MAFTRLSCPECGKVLRPAQPVAAGKKVKCPECATIFVAGEDEEEPPRKASGPSKAKKAAPAKAKEPAKKEPPKKEEEEIYGYIKEEEPEDDDDDYDDDEDDDEDRPRKRKKPKIDYAPDESIRDLRGPAIVMLTGPSTKVQLVGMFGVFGWLILFVLLLIPTLFPITPDEQEKERAKQAAAGMGPDGKKVEVKKGPGFFEVFEFDLSAYFFWLMGPMIALGVYSALVVSGGIQAQNLESRRWGIAAAVMSMLPLHISGFALTTLLVVQWGVNLVLEDPDFGMLVAGILMGIEYLISLGVGAWLLSTLMKEEVIEGFEFDPD